MQELTSTQLQDLQDLLSQQELALQAHIRSECGTLADEPFAQLTGAVTDRGDEASADVMVDLDHAKVGLQLAQLRDIGAARARMQAGSYGMCLDCGETIDFARLKVWPVAKRCLICQQAHEHRQGHVHATM